MRSLLRRRRVWIALAAVLITVLVLASLVSVPANQMPDFQAKVAAEAQRAGDGGQLDFGRMQLPRWDRMFVFGAYTSNDEIREAIGVDWSPQSRLEKLVDGNSPLNYDGMWLLIFMDNRTVSGWAEFGTGGGALVRFSGATGGRVFTPRSALFRVRDATGELVDPRIVVWELSPVQP